jgi:hypothetical protein
MTTKIPVELSSTPGIVDGSNATAITIDSSEKVGIGTGSPSTLLHLDGTTNHTYLTVEANSGASNAIKFVGANTWTLGNDTASGVGDNNFALLDGSDVRITVDASGKVGIGTTSPSSPLDVRGGNVFVDGGGSGGASQVILTTSASSGSNFGQISNTGTRWSLGYGSSIGTVGTEVLTWNSSNAVGIGTTAPTANNVKRLYITGGESVMAVRNTNATDPSQRVQIEFFDNGGTRRGYISSSNASTVFSTSSDYRLKEVLEPLPNGLDRLKELNPVKFKWTDSGHIQEGFIAHEAQKVFPDAIGGEKDAVKEDGSLDLQTMDYGRITPLLVKAIQEQQEQIEQLKVEIQTLKGE